MNPNFHKFFDHLEQVCLFFIVFSIPNNLFGWKPSENSGCIVLELVVGSGEQGFNFNITYEKFIEIDITSSGFNPRPQDDRDDKLWE